MIAIRMAAMAATIGISAAAVPAAAQQSGRNNTSPQAPGAAAQQGQLSDATVQKVGQALRSMATIRQEYTAKAQSTKSQEQQKDLTDHAQSDMAKAISDQGLSVQQYNQVIQMAQADPNLKQRLLSVVQSGE
jgi:Domain of unknown function (DUF4168)